MTDSSSELPCGLESYKRTAVFTETSVPAGLLSDHRTKDGVWGLIHVEQGQLVYRVTDARRVRCERTLSPGEAPGVVEPTISRHVQPIGETAFWVEFFRAAPLEGTGDRAVEDGSIETGRPGVTVVPCEDSGSS